MGKKISSLQLTIAREMLNQGERLYSKRIGEKLKHYRLTYVEDIEHFRECEVCEKHIEKLHYLLEEEKNFYYFHPNCLIE
ncbi:hypothetical protein CL616_04330 [archaeon]|nr:hypothetical protein [archaeon]